MSHRTIYQLLIDDSASMQAILEESIIGINNQIKHIREVGLRNPEDEVLVSLYFFNHTLRKVYQNKEARFLNDLNILDFKPEGMSAFYDALGMCILDLKRFTTDFVAESEWNVVVIIFSDGIDNASNKFSIDELNDTIRELNETNQWSFIFIGTGLKSKQVAESLAIVGYNYIFFSSDSALKILGGGLN